MIFQEMKVTLMQIEKFLIEEDLLYDFISCKHEDLCLCHFGLGLWIRNHLLTQDSNLINLFRKYGVNDKDAISSLLIELLFLFLKEKHNIFIDSNVIPT